MPFSGTSFSKELCSNLSRQIESLFLVNFQVSPLNENHHLLVKLSCKAFCENIDAFSARPAVDFFQPILQLSKESSLPSLRLHFSYLYTSDQGPDKGGAALLVKRRNSKWSFTNEPEVRFRFRF